MREFDEIRQKSVCITGHRTIEDNIKQDTFDHLDVLIKRGYSIFYVGMAVGFDTLCFQFLEKLREKNGIKIIACVPCPSQPERFSYAQKKEYFRMLESADEKIVLSPTYTPYCMQKRNQYMVDNSSVCIAYKTSEKGGTAYTVKYANKAGLEVVNLGQFSSQLTFC